MIFMHRPQTDPFFNLAAEEFLLKNRQEEFVMIWQSTASVVVGKHQNVIAEVNTNFVNQHNIPVIRRLSGGGTVYHDLGNINLSVITTVEKGENLIDFKKFTKPVIDFLQQFGLTATFRGKNNLTIEGKKFSGNAAHIQKNRVLHHGTLLYNSNLDHLGKIIRYQNNHISDKAVKSVRATVENISTFLSHPPATGEFIQRLKSFLKKYYQITSETGLSVSEQQAISRLADKKYKSWKWNNGYSPKYLIQQQKDTVYGRFQVVLEVEEGIISLLELTFEGKRLEKIEQKLTGEPHDKQHLQKILVNNRFSEIIINNLF